MSSDGRGGGACPGGGAPDGPYSDIAILSLDNSRAWEVARVNFTGHTTLDDVTATL